MRGLRRHARKEISPWAALFLFCTVRSRIRFSAAICSARSRPFLIRRTGIRTVSDFCSHCSAINIVAIAGSYGCSFMIADAMVDALRAPTRFKPVEARGAALAAITTASSLHGFLPWPAASWRSSKREPKAGFRLKTL
jgi:hypothetical protein